MQVEQERAHRGVQGCTQVGRQGLMGSLVVVVEEEEEALNKKKQINTEDKEHLQYYKSMQNKSINRSDVWYLTLIWPHVLLQGKIQR